MMKFHPYCEVFPLLEGEAFEELVADIKANGLREEIWMYQGMVLDGRNRFRACQKANERLRTRDFKGTDQAALALVISANVHRRHLTASQLAMAAAKIANLKVGSNQHSPKKSAQDGKGPPKGGPSDAPPISIENASKMVGAKPRSTERARKVIERGSKPLQDAVDSGEVPVTRAASVVDLPRSEQLAAATAKTAPASNDEPERPDDGEDAGALEAAEQDWRARMDKILGADDRLAEMAKQLKQTQDELTAAKQARDRYMNENAALLRQNKALQRKLDRLEKKAA